MKNIFTLIVLIVLTVYAKAQEEKTIYVLDGYTLKPLTGFSVTGESRKLSFQVDLNTISIPARDKGSIVIQKAGYYPETVEIKSDTDLEVILNPTTDKKNELRNIYLPQAVRPQPATSGNATTTAFTVVSEPAEFPGGKDGLIRFLSQNLNYPEPEVNHEIEGRLYVSFIIDSDGSISDVKIAKGLTLNTEIEAIRVINLMPRWIPGKVDGKAVKSYFNLPLTFKLQ